MRALRRSSDRDDALRPETANSRGHVFGAGPPRRPGARRLSSTDSSRYEWKEIPGSSHDVLRRALFELPAGGALLDIGAGPGHLGAAVAGHFGYVAGVEADASTAPPPGIYHRWVAGAADPAAVWERSFDAIVLADVLEHLDDPASMLAAARRWIAPGGLLLVSLPNVANIAVRLSLLAGRFEYADRGILDRTHLRFFTRRSARRAIEAAGFAIARVRATPVPAELALPAFGHPPWNIAVRALAAGAARIRPTLFGYQFVFFARPR